MSRLKRVSFILFGVLLASCASQVSVSPTAQPNAGLTPATFCTAVRPPSPEPGLLTVIEKGQDQQRLACLLDQLDEDRQELLRLRFSGGLSFSEISPLDLHPSQPLDQLLLEATPNRKPRFLRNKSICESRFHKGDF